jgi:polyhydroxybutyrate depolymerase
MRGTVRVALLVATALAADPAPACGPTSDCAVAGGDYRVWTPPDDGGPASGAIVFLHGYAADPAAVMGFAALRAVAAELGVALIAPRGVDGSWRLPGAFPAGRDDVAFVGAVVDHAVARFGLDRTRVVVSGFSLGASMAWYVACAEGRRYAGYAPVAGAFWEPYVDACRTPLAPLHHVHGTGDRVVPIAGRPLSFATQGDVRRSVALLRDLGGCPGPMPPASAEGALACARVDCGGAVLELCLHPGGHAVEPAWIARAWRAIEAAGAPDRD